MRKRWVLAVLLALAGGSAGAVSKGGTLYVKAKNTRLMESSAPRARALRVLQPGQTVKWLGADPRDKQWHQVEVEGQRGVVFQTTLSTRPPQQELVASPGGATRRDPSEFANSAAAVKLLSDGAIQYGQRKGGGVQDAVGQLQRLETLARGVQDKELAEHARAAGLFPVVGPSAEAGEASTGSGGRP